jgi:glycosyltransferase involved in cell wall biosynthesis
MRAGGIFTYSIGILKLLLSAETVKEIFLIYPKDQEKGLGQFFQEPKITAIPINPKRIGIKYRSILSFFFLTSYYVYQTYFNKYFPNFNHFNLIRKLAIFLNPYRSIIDNLQLNVLHVPFKISPVYGIKTPIVVTMHDIQELHFPEFFTSQERIDRAITYKIAIDESSHIVVSFDHIKQDLIKFFQVPEEKISVCRLPLANSWFVSNNYTTKSELLKKYGIKDRFLLYPAASWQHKNHLTLLEAISLLKERSIEAYLVCTGNKNNFFEVIEKEIEKLGLQNCVKFLGVVLEEDLLGLYKSTELTVIPTLYEAGSGPLFESMRYGAAVICSNVTSLPETIGNIQYTFDPLNPEEIADLIEKGLCDKAWKKRNIENSIKRINYYKNLNADRDFINVYQLIKRT